MKNALLWIGPLLAAVIGYALFASGASWAVAWTAGVGFLCAFWWVTEPIPIPATSLLPIAILPLVGVLTPKQVGEAYGHKLILLLMGGFILSTAMERSGAHRRIALLLVRLFGGPDGRGGGRQLVFGFMAASAVLSMWISNTATVLMLVPIVMAVLERNPCPRLRLALLLGIAYAASVGGVGTPIGTPTNLVFMEVYSNLVGEEPSFMEWMGWALPIVVVMLPIVALWLTRNLGEQSKIELPEVGAWRTQEIRTLAVFGLTALLWVTRKGPFGGWSEWTGLTGANDASVALLAVVVMFLIPTGEQSESGETERLLDWETAVKIPWGLLILFAGGMVLAKGFTASGLGDTVGGAMGQLATLPTPLLVLSICLAVTFLTEVTSNTATTMLLMPLLAAMAVKTGIEPRLIMIPAAISASFAFMLPVATPPNAVVYGCGGLSIKQMAREGLVLNLIGAVLISAICYWQFG